MQLTTRYPGENCIFTWTNVRQPSSASQENKLLLTEIVESEFVKYPDLDPNAAATDCSPSEVGHVNLMRVKHKLLIWIKHLAHCTDTVVKVPICTLICNTGNPNKMTAHS